MFSSLMKLLLVCLRLSRGNLGPSPRHTLLLAYPYTKLQDTSSTPNKSELVLSTYTLHAKAPPKLFEETEPNSASGITRSR